MLKKFVSYYKPYKKLFFLDLFVATISALCDLFYPMITREIANNSIPNREIRAIGVFAGVLLVIYLIKNAMCLFYAVLGTLSWSWNASRYEKRYL